jgi:photosystem II stability/assembly factor-like uncharacterized protein
MALTLTESRPNGQSGGQSYYRGRAISSDGQKIIVAEVLSYGRNIWRSDDGGTTWALKSTYPSPNGYPYNCYIAASDDFNTIVIAYNYGYLWVSVNGGTSWTQRNTSARNYAACAVSADGSKMLACVQNGRAYRSLDAGTTWSEVQPAGASDKYWNIAEISGDGSVMILGIGDGLSGRAYISRNSGGSWYLLDPNGYGDSFKWTSAALSSDGAKIILTASTGNGCFRSSDSGQTWQYVWPMSGSYDGVNRYYFSSAILPDGSRAMIGGYAGSGLMPFIYSSVDGGMTWQNATPSGCSAYQAFVAANFNRGTPIKGYAAQTAGGKFWLLQYTAENVRITVPKLEGQSRFALNSAAIVQRVVAAPAIRCNSRLTVKPFNGWEEIVPDFINETGLSAIGAGFTERGEMKCTAALLAGFMMVQSQVMIPQFKTDSEAACRQAFCGKWVDSPLFQDQSVLDFYIAAGWHEGFPAGKFPMIIKQYCPSADGQTVLAIAASDKYYLFRSFDGGQSWQKIVSTEFGSLNIERIAISGDGKIMMAVGATYYNVDSPLWLSTDSGSTWQLNDMKNVESIAINYDGSVILVTGEYYIKQFLIKGYISRDRGKTWQVVYPMGRFNTLNGHTEISEFWTFAVSGDGNVIIASGKDLYDYIYLGPGQGGYYERAPDQRWYRSYDGGMTWSDPMPTFYSEHYPATEIRLNYDGSVGEFGVNDTLESEPTPFCWVKLLDMNKEDWDSSYLPTPGWSVSPDHPYYLATELKPDGSTDERLLAAEMFTGRVWLSLDSGATWAETRPAGDRGLLWKKTWIFPDRIMADGFDAQATPQRRILYMSENNGAFWEAEVTAQSGYFSWGAVAMSANGDVQIAGRNGGGCFLSHDRGMTWERIVPSVGSERQWATLGMSDDGQVIVAGSFITFDGPRAFFSVDSGAHWTEIDLPERGTDQFPTVAVSRSGERLVVAYGSIYDQGRVLISIDRGTHWVTAWPKGEQVEAAWDWVAIYDSGAVWASVGEYMYRSMDNGVSWLQKQVPGGQVTAAQCGDESGQILFVGTHNGRLWKSDDWGDSWVEVRPAGDTDGYWYGLSCNRAAGRLIVANDGGKVYRSMDAGETWTDMKVRGIVDDQWSDVAIDFSGEIMAACGTMYFAYDIVRPGGQKYLADAYPFETQSQIITEGPIWVYLPIVPEMMSEGCLLVESADAWSSTHSICRYRCYLSKEGLPDQEVRASGVDCAMNSEGKNYLSLVLPAVVGLADILTQYQGGQIVVYQELVNPDGATLRRKLAQADIGSIRLDAGTGSRSVTISGYFPAKSVPDTVTLKTTYESVYENGKRQWRFAGAPVWVRPGNTIQKPDGTEKIVVDRVTIWLSPSRVQVEATGNIEG